MEIITLIGEMLSDKFHHYPALLLVLTTALLFMVGLVAQILSDRTSIPAIIFLLLFGSLLGKYGLNLINPDIYGSNGLRAIIAVAVAIVVFEGGLLIDIKLFKQNWVTVLGLGTVNVFVTILGTAWVTFHIVGVEWKISLLYASLVSVTGPTVISPILRRIQVRQKVKAILETEAVLVDAIGVIVAVSIFNYVVATEQANFDAANMDIFGNILLALVKGGVSGGICAWGARQIVKLYSPRGEVTRLLVLATTLSAYTLGEFLVHEGGIAAVAVAGFIIGNTDFPHKHSIKEFKGDLTLLSITVVFLLLSASLDIKYLASIGINGAICVLLLMVVIRPIGVFLSTLFDKISWRERVFIASLGPRGIVAASAATFFALEMDTLGIDGSNTIRGLVFMTILMTVVIQGSGARYMAELLDIAPDSVLIIGAGTIGKKLIYQLKDSQTEGIIVIDNDEKTVEELQPLAHEGVYIIKADARNENIYKTKLNHAQHISTIIATSDDDWLNLRVCQIVKRMKPEIQMISVINDVKGREVFENLGIKTINLREAAATVIYVLMDTKLTTDTLET